MAEEENSSFPGLIMLILIIFFLASAYIMVQNNYFPARSSMEDASSFFQMFHGIVTDDKAEVTQHLNQGLTFFGIFILLFLLLFFALTTFLPHLFSKRTATFLAFIITIYAFTNNRIYGYIIDFASYLVSILVFLALILVLWGGFKEMDHEKPPKPTA